MISNPQQIQPVAQAAGAERRAEGILERMRDAHCALDRDFRIVGVNAAAERLFVRSRETLLGRSLWEVLPASVDAPVGRAFRRVVAEGVEQHLTHQFVGEGDDLRLELDAYPTDEGGVAIFWRDVTERVPAEVSLRLAAARDAYRLALTDTLRGADDPLEAQAVATRLLGDHLGASRVMYGEADPGSAETFTIHREYRRDPAMPTSLGGHRWDEFGTYVATEMRAGRTLVVNEVRVPPGHSADELAAYEAVGIRAYVAVPLVREERIVAYLAANRTMPQAWAAEEIALIEETAERTWAAVECVRAEKALGKSEEKYRTLFNSIDEGVCTIEVLFDEQDKAVDYRFLEINPAHETMSGVGPDVLGKCMSEVLPTIEQSVLDRLGHVALTGEPIRFEEYVSALHRWFDVYAVRVGGEGSHTVASMFNNITERKQREHHAAFLDKLSQALVLLDSPDEIVRATGEALGAYLDVSFVHVVGVELDPGDEPAEARLTALAAWEREGFFVASGAYRAGDYLSEEFLRAASAGESIVIRDTDTDPRTDREAYRAVGIRAFIAVPILKDGAWPGLIAVGTPGVRDWRPDEVTLIVEVAHRVFPRMERVRADKTLRASAREIKRARDYAEATLRTSPLPLLVLEKDLRVNTVNDAFYQVFKVDRAETEGRLVYDLGNGQWNIPKLRELLEDILPHHTALHEFEVSHDFESIGPRTMLLNARWMENEPGMQERIVLVLEDVTERKQATEAMRRSEAALRDADRRKDEFIAMLAHELRNPLAPIRTGLELIRLAGDTPGSVERVRGMMERQIGHMVRLVDDLLDVSRITAGKIQLQREPAPLNTLVNSAIEANRAAIAAKQVELTVDLPPTLCVLDVDPTRFIQVISNLLHNAVKFTEVGGSIRVLAHIDGSDGDTLRKLSLSVTDSGIGISPELLPHIFDLFTQGDRGSSQPGLGIGLALARRLVEMHGGEIEVRSDGPGTGSQFVIRLPVAVTDVPPRTAAEQIDLRSLARRVVVIDDNHDAANAIAMLVDALGGECRVVYDGMSGVREVLSYRPDVVLLDIGMPGFDGYETCSQIRQELGRDVSVIALTGWGQEHDRQHAVLAGFDAHLTKPADPRELAKLLSELPVHPRPEDATQRLVRSAAPLINRD